MYTPYFITLFLILNVPKPVAVHKTLVGSFGNSVKIGQHMFNAQVLAENFDERQHIHAPARSLVLAHTFMGEVDFTKVEEAAESLKVLSRSVLEEHGGTSKIKLSAWATL